MNHDHHAMDGCVQACLDCHKTCVSTIAHCLKLGGHHADAAHIGIMMDCAQISALCADFMLRGSPHHAHVCPECAEICTKCAVSCETHGKGDAAMAACAAACRKCAAECAKMAA